MIKPEKIHGTSFRKGNDPKQRQRVPRRTASGPIGFGQVFGMVRRELGKGRGKGQHGASGEGAGDASQQQIARAQQRPGDIANVAGATGANASSALALDAQVVNSVSTGSEPATSSTATAGASDTTLSRSELAMTPQQAAHTVVDEARRMRLVADARRELHLELEPAHLGPIVVRIMVDRGTIRTEIRARKQRAANILASGSEALRERLAALGYASAEVIVEVDPDA